MKLSKQKAYMNHYRMWNEIVKDPNKEKNVAIMKLRMKRPEEYDCYLCALIDGGHGEDSCERCPIPEQGGGYCNVDENWYSSFENGNMKDRKKYAKLIRDCVLPYLTKKSKEELGLEE